MFLTLVVTYNNTHTLELKLGQLNCIFCCDWVSMSEPQTCVFNVESCRLSQVTRIVHLHSVSFTEQVLCPAVKPRLNNTYRGRGEGWPLRLWDKRATALCIAISLTFAPVHIHTVLPVTSLYSPEGTSLSPLKLKFKFTVVYSTLPTLCR